MKNNNNFEFNAVRAATNPTIGLNTMNTVDCVNTGHGFDLRSKESLKSKYNSSEPSIKEEINPSNMNENYKRSDYENLVYGIKMYADTDNSRLDIAGGSIYLELRRLIYKCAQVDTSTFSKSNYQYQYNQIGNTLYNPINSLMLDPGMNIVNQCIFSMIDRNILSHNNFDTEYICYGDILHNTIETLFDMYHICDDENSKRVFKFIDYFIKTFKPEK